MKGWPACSTTVVPIHPFVTRVQGALANQPSSLQGRFVRELATESVTKPMTVATTTQRRGPRILGCGLVAADIKLVSALDAGSGTVPPQEDIRRLVRSLLGEFSLISLCRGSGTTGKGFEKDVEIHPRVFEI